MARDKGWIGKYCSQGQNFGQAARSAMALPIGDTYYVDLLGGSDGNTGESFASPFLTINHAYDSVGSDSNDYVLVRGYKDITASGIVATLDVGYTHVLGHAGLMNPYFPEKGSLSRTDESNEPYVNITAEFVEFAGFSVHGHQGDTNASTSTRSKGSLQLGTYAAGGGHKAYVHNCHFPDWNHEENTAGITVTGSHYFVLEDNVVDSIYGNIDEAVYIAGSSGANPANAVIDGLWAKGGTGGALHTAIKLNAGSSLQSSYVNRVWGARSTYLVDFISDFTTGYNSFNNMFGNMATNAIFNAATTIDARDTLASVMGSIAGPNVYGTVIFPDTA